MLTQTNVNVEITVKQFTYIYKNKIQVALNEKEEMTSKFEFKDMNLLLSAYEYWKYENQNKKTFVQLEKDAALDTDEKDYQSFLETKKTVLQKRVDSFATTMASPKYELVVNIIGIINILCIVVRQVDLTDTSGMI